MSIALEEYSSLIVGHLRSHTQKVGAIVTTVIILYGVCTITLYQGLWLPFIPSVLGVAISAVAISIKYHRDLGIPQTGKM